MDSRDRDHLSVAFPLISTIMPFVSIISTGLAIIGPALKNRNRVGSVEAAFDGATSSTDFKTMEQPPTAMEGDRRARAGAEAQESKATKDTYQLLQALVDHLSQYVFLVYVLCTFVPRHKTISFFSDGLFLVSCTLVLVSKALLPLSGTVASCFAVIVTDVREGGLLDTTRLTTALYVFPALALALVLAGASYALRSSSTPSTSAARLLIVSLAITTILSTFTISLLLYILNRKAREPAWMFSSPSFRRAARSSEPAMESTPTKPRAGQRTQETTPESLTMHATSQSDAASPVKLNESTASASAHQRLSFLDLPYLPAGDTASTTQTASHAGTFSAGTLASSKDPFGSQLGVEEGVGGAGTGTRSMVNTLASPFGRFRTHLSVGRGYASSSLNPARPASAFGTGGTGFTQVTDGTKASSDDPYNGPAPSHGSSSARFGSRSTAHTLASSTLNPSSSSSSSVMPLSVRPVPRYHHLDGNEHEGILLRPENIIGEESLEDVIQQSLAHLAPPVDDADEAQAQTQEGPHLSGQVTVEPSIAVHDDTLDRDLYGEISRSSLPKDKKLLASHASRSPTPGFSYEQDDASSIVLISRPSSSQATTTDLLEPAAQIQGPSLFRRTFRTSTIHFSRSGRSTLPYARLLDTFGVAMLLRTQPAAREEWSDENNQSGVKDPWKDARMRLSVLCVSIWLSFILALPLLCSAIVKGNDAEPSLGAFICMILSISLTGPLLALQVILSKGFTFVVPEWLSNLGSIISFSKEEQPLHSTAHSRMEPTEARDNESETTEQEHQEEEDGVPVAGVGFEDVNGYDSPVYGRVPGRWRRQYDKRDSSKGRSSAILPVNDPSRARRNRHRAVRSVPFPQEHWRAGAVEGDHVASTRSGLERLLNLLSAHPKLEVLAQQAKQLSEELAEEVEGDVSISSISMVDIELGPSQELIQNIIRKLQRSLVSSRHGGPIPGALDATANNEALLNVHARSRSEGASAGDDYSVTYDIDALSAWILPRLVPGLCVGPEMRIRTDDDHYSLLEEFEELRRRTASTTSRNTTSCDGPLTGLRSESEHRQGTQDIPVSGDSGDPSSKKAIRPPRRGAVRQRRADNSTGAISTQSLVNDRKSLSPSGDELVAERLDGRVEEAMLEMIDKGKQTEEGTAWLDSNSAATDASPLTEKDYQVSPARRAEDQVQSEELLSHLNRSLASELGLSPTPSEIRRKRYLSAELGLLVEKDEEKHHEALESADTVSPLKQDKWKRRSLGSEMGLKQFSYDDLDAPNGSPVSSQVGRRRTSIEWGSASKRSKKAESSSCGGSVLSVGTETEIIISPDVTLERKGSVKSVCASVTEDQAEQQAAEKKVEAQEELQQHIVVLEGSYSDETCQDEEGPAPIQHPEMEISSAEHEEDIGNVTSQCSIEEVLFVCQAGAVVSDEGGEEIPRRPTYQPGMPLELLEEVTEEPTVSEVSDESVTGLQASNAKRGEGLPGSDKEQIVTMSTPPRAQGISQMLDRSWERLHGLGTPSSIGGTSAYGWAELHPNSSSPRSASRSPSKSTTPRTRPSMSKKIHQQRLHQQLASHAVLSPFSSPQKVIGLNSSFWINSPQPVKLELQKLIYSQANAPLDPFSSSSKVISPRTRPRLLADQMEMIQNDDDDWVELEADEEKVTANRGRSASTTRRWKRMSASSTMSLASIATSTTSGSLRRSSNGSSVLENLQQASKLKGKSKERRSLHEIWSGKKHGKTGTADTPATPTHPTSKRRDATTLGLDALNSENGKTDLGESDGGEKTPVTASQILHHRAPSPPASSMGTSMRATGGCEEEEGDHGSSYSTDAVSIKSCKRTSFARPQRVLITPPSSAFTTVLSNPCQEDAQDEEAHWQDEPDSAAEMRDQEPEATLLPSPSSYTKRRRYAIGSPSTASSPSRKSMSSCSSATKVTGSSRQIEASAMSNAMTFASPLREMRGPHRHRRTPGSLHRQGGSAGGGSPCSMSRPRAQLPSVHIRPPSSSTSVPMEHHFP